MLVVTQNQQITVHYNTYRVSKNWSHRIICIWCHIWSWKLKLFWPESGLKIYWHPVWLHVLSSTTCRSCDLWWCSEVKYFNSSVGESWVRWAIKMLCWVVTSGQDWLTYLTNISPGHPWSPLARSSPESVLEWKIIPIKYWVVRI